MSTNPHGPILPRNGGLYHEKIGDKYHLHDGVTSNLSLGDDESNDSVEFSKEDLHHPTHGKGNIGKQMHYGRKKRRRHEAITHTFQAQFVDWLRCNLVLFGNEIINIY
jgi:hypothetical protein